MFTGYYGSILEQDPNLKAQRSSSLPMGHYIRVTAKSDLIPDLHHPWGQIQPALAYSTKDHRGQASC